MGWNELNRIIRCQNIRTSTTVHGPAQIPTPTSSSHSHTLTKSSITAPVTHSAHFLHLLVLPEAPSPYRLQHTRWMERRDVYPSSTLIYPSLPVVHPLRFALLAWRKAGASVLQGNIDLLDSSVTWRQSASAIKPLDVWWTEQKAADTHQIWAWL